MLNRFKNRGRLTDGADQASSDAIYLRGGWDRLGHGEDLARFGVIAGLCAERDAGSILDVGCGDGLLASRLTRFRSYVGVDISPVAVSRATERLIPNATFSFAEAQSYEPEGSFDVIIFNEVLYYLEAPEKVAGHLAESLNPGGAIVVSIHRSPRHQWVWRNLGRLFSTVDGFCVEHIGGERWDVRVLQPKA